MPYCAILECKNDSRRKNRLHGGVSYHRFPADPFRKEEWMKATGRQKWMPLKSSTICSDHFHEKEYLISEKGYRFLKDTSVPTVNIVIFHDNKQNVNAVTPGPSKRQVLESCFCEDPEPVIPHKKARLTEVSTPIIDVASDCLQNQRTRNTKKPHHSVKLCASSSQSKPEGGEKSSSSSTFSSPRKRKLKEQLRWSQEKIKEQELKIKRLRAQNRRFKKKITNIEEILKSLEQKFGMGNENLDCLKQI